MIPLAVEMVMEFIVIRNSSGKFTLLVFESRKSAIFTISKIQLEAIKPNLTSLCSIF